LSQIAGWKIVGNVLSGSNATLDAAGAALFKSDQGPDTDGTAAFDILRDEYYIDFTPADQGNTKNYYVKFGPNFAVDDSGTLHASGAVFQGTITASAGLIGGFTTDDHAFSGTNFFISGSATGDQRFISTTNFNVKASGDITGSQVLFTGGKISEWEIDGHKLKSSGDGGIRLNANGDNSEISVNSHTFGNAGIQLGYNGGSPRFYAGDGTGNDHIKYITGTGVNIKTATLNIDTSTFDLSTDAPSFTEPPLSVDKSNVDVSIFKVAVFIFTPVPVIYFM
jgi:hypothetical protein